jgi:hypothetical protein
MTNAGPAIGHAWPVPEPGPDARRGNRLRQFRKRAEQMLAQDVRALPVRRGIQARNLDCARGAQPLIGPVDYHFGVGNHKGSPWTRAGVLDHDVIAALGLQWQVIADGGRNRL